MMLRNNLLFVCTCFLLAIIAEVCLFEDMVGISYSIVIASFYLFFFYRFRTFTFSHKQISGIVFVSIWILTITFGVNPYSIFSPLNFIIIPILVFVHIVLLTSLSTIPWYSNSFLRLIAKKISETFKQCNMSVVNVGKLLKSSMNESVYRTGKKIGIGIFISIPLLFVITLLLSAADQQFANLLSVIPKTLFNFQLEFLWRIVKIGVIAVLFIGFFNAVVVNTVIVDNSSNKDSIQWDGIIVTTILIVINLVYLLFTIVQFQYFFNGSLNDQFSYSEYARRGFFELIIVSIINFALLISVVTFHKKNISMIIKGLLTLLIVFSGVMLTSAFLRLMMYEQAYGFTYLRILAHSFMILLTILFAYTLVKVWIQRLSLIHFYIISTLLYYVGLNMVGVDQMIVSKNINRYEHTGKIDTAYLSTLSYAAIPKLVELYKHDPSTPGLKSLLINKRDELTYESTTWQAFNLSKQKAALLLKEIE
ncbi:DUF4153 domain-containing protein [Bacillus sp. 03113]|uniref:DUF4153 domain-containing protein n=1 Tax=Bacillus sp. 03113 TaxID=2578211 RepID=UPI001142D38A|nr:DUF4173 domain-containing protein [Bacillus sp. 03113]